MSFFGALVRTVVNVATLPVAVAKDIVTLGNSYNGEDMTATERKLKQIKDEADS